MRISNGRIYRIKCRIYITEQMCTLFSYSHVDFTKNIRINVIKSQSTYNNKRALSTVALRWNSNENVVMQGAVEFPVETPFPSFHNGTTSAAAVLTHRSLIKCIRPLPVFGK